MKKQWLITGTLSVGLALTAAPAAMAKEWNTIVGASMVGDIAAGSGVIGNIVARAGDGKDISAGSGIVEVQAMVPGAEINATAKGSVAENITAGSSTIEDTTAKGNVTEDVAVGDGAADFAEGSGIVPTATVQPGDVQDVVQQGEIHIDRTIGKNFIKQLFIECIGRERSQVEEILGVSGEPEETEDYAAEKFDFHITYVLDNDEDVRIDYKNNIAVRIFGTNTELLNFEKDEYSLSEIDAILEVTHVTLEGNAYFWHLQDDPDVTMELVNSYASLNAY